MIHQVEYHAVRGLVFLLNCLPFALTCWAARRTGDLFLLIARKRRRVGLENLDRAYGSRLTSKEKLSLLRQSFQNAAVSIIELFLVDKILRNPRKHFNILGLSYFHEALSRGKGAILVTSHLGSWEYLAFLFYLQQVPCSPIVKNLKNPDLDRAIDEQRRKMSLTPIPKKNAIRRALMELKKNHFVPILIDQWAGREGLWNHFFGHETSTTSLPARLAKKTGCALLPAYCIRKSTGHYEIQLEQPFYVEEKPNWEWDVTNKINRNLEKKILEYPGHWSWGHRRWKSKPDQLRETDRKEISL